LAVFSHATTLMRRFLYRLPRFKTELRMDFIVGDSVTIGTCVNLSESGLRGTFSEAVGVNTQGMLTLYFEETGTQVHGRVEALKGDEVRVRFRFASVQERDGIRSLLKRLPASSVQT
jgi:hypothetical protein